MKDETNNACVTPIGEVLYQHIHSNATIHKIAQANN